MNKQSELQLIGLAENAIQRGNLGYAKKILLDIQGVNESHLRANELLGLILKDEGDLDGAIRYLSRAGLNSKCSPKTLYVLGTLFNQKGQFEEALKVLKRATAKGASFFELFHDLALTLGVMGRTQEAIEIMDKALGLNQFSAEALYNQGRLFDDIKQFDQSIISYQRALSYNPHFIEAYINYGIALYELGRPQEALQCYQNALQINPQSLDTLLNQGMAFQALNQYGEAMQSYEKALECENSFAAARLNKSLVELTLTNFEEGWKNYEWRFQAVKSNPRLFTNIPLLRNLENISGAKLLVWHEQGFGDTIQFCRFIPLIAKKGADIKFLVQKPLKGLMDSLGGCTVIDDVESIGRVDYQIPLLSIPKLFKVNASNIPNKVPYLSNSSRCHESIKKILESKSGRKLAIGIACSGSPEHTNDSRRSMPLIHFIPLLQFGSLFLIQKGIRSSDQVILKENDGIVDCTDVIENFEDSAALVQNMDLIITVDTSLAHLSGALNQKTFVCLPHSPEWRWQLSRSDSPWYPSITLFRQKKLGDWSSVISQIVASLSELNI